MARHRWSQSIRSQTCRHRWATTAGSAVIERVRLLTHAGKRRHATASRRPDHAPLQVFERRRRHDLIRVGLSLHLHVVRGCCRDHHRKHGQGTEQLCECSARVHVSHPRFSETTSPARPQASRRDAAHAPRAGQTRSSRPPGPGRRSRRSTPTRCQMSRTTGRRGRRR
jgi:hypothetical protein